MKGKKIQLIITKLPEEGREMLKKIFISSGDKRAQALVSWLDSGKEMEDFLDGFEGKLLAGAEGEERDKRIRRWVSFVTKELERALVWSLLGTNPKKIPETILSLLPDSGPDSFREVYVEEAVVESQNSGEWEHFLKYNMGRIQGYLRQQTEGAMKKARGLVFHQNRVVRQVSLARRLETINLVSALFLDNDAIPSWFPDDFPTDLELRHLLEETQGKPQEAEVLLIMARLHHQGPEFWDYLAECESKAHFLSGRTRDVLLRRICFLRLIVGFDRGAKTPQLFQDAAFVFKINEKYKFPDAVGFFHYLLQLLFQGRPVDVRALLKERSPFYFGTDNKYLEEFILTLGAYLFPGQLHSPPSKWLALGYSRNIYVANWSAFLFLAVQYRKGALDLCETLLERVRKRKPKLEGRSFLRQASERLTVWFEEAITKMTLPDPPWGMSPIHDCILRVALGLEARER